MSVQRDDQATGLRRLWSLALRVLTLLACVGRRRLAAEGTQRAGLSAGHAKRETARPTAERLLEGLHTITLTVLEEPQQTYRHLTALSPLHQSMLEIFGFSSEVYTRLGSVFPEPP
jgi:transposase